MPESYTEDFLEAVRLRAVRCRLIATGKADPDVPMAPSIVADFL
jgi:hypothetical protein